MTLGLPKSSDIAVKLGKRSLSYLDLDCRAQDDDFASLFELKKYEDHAGNVGIMVEDKLAFVQVLMKLWSNPIALILLEPQADKALKEQIVSCDIDHIVSDLVLPNYKIVGQFLAAEKRLWIYQATQSKNNPVYVKDGFIGLFTSGSSGKPKLCVLDKSSVIENAKAVQKYLNIGSQHQTFLTLPLTYSYGLSQLLIFLRQKALVQLGQSLFTPDLALQSLASIPCSHYAATPYFYEAMASQSSSVFGSIQHISTWLNAGGYINPSRIETICKKLPNSQFINNYGQTEAGPRLGYSKFTSSSKSYQGIQSSVYGVELNIEAQDARGIGQIVYQSSYQMLGYYHELKAGLKMPKKRQTGDIGRVSEGGGIELLGRRDQMLKINGRKVYPQIIQQKIQSLESVRNILIQKKNHATFGEYLEAQVCPENKLDDPHKFKLQLRSYLRQRLSKWEIPRHIIVSDSLAVNANGKILGKKP